MTSDAIADSNGISVIEERSDVAIQRRAPVFAVGDGIRPQAGFDGPRILNINCWNEWTEGSYLEPDTRNGTAFLEAVKDVFKQSSNGRDEQ
jgi:hypothetical protein